MPRRARCIVPDVPCHVTQRGVDHGPTFSSDIDRSTYLRLLHQNLADAQVRILGWCLMPNHVHLIALPQREDSLAILLRRVHGRYAQYYNARDGRVGHLWQNRFFACILGPQHLWAALAYVDRNPVRAGMVTSAGEYPWSSAAAHLSGVDPSRLVDMDWWRQQEFRGDWAAELTREAPECATQLRKCTYAGRPFGTDDLVEEVGRRFGRSWTRGRPKKEAGAATAYDRDAQFPLFM